MAELPQNLGLDQIKNKVYVTVAAGGSHTGYKLSHLLVRFYKDWGLHLQEYVYSNGFPNVSTMLRTFSDVVELEEYGNLDEPKIFPVPLEATRHQMELIDESLRDLQRRRRGRGRRHLRTGQADDGYDSE